MVERVKGWKTSDGQSFPTKGDAERHEAKAKLAARLAGWLENHPMDDGTASTAEHIVDQIEADPAGFRSLIRPLVSRVARKPKAAGAPAGGKRGKRGKAAPPLAAE
jgi:hypothetical protein